MSYALKYQATFDSFKGPLESYVVNIYQKDYVGDDTTLLLSGTPVVQEWQEDDPKAPIRGCTLNVSIITDINGVKLTDFYSDDDTGFYVEFICTNTNQYLFKGYLLQDDCREIQVDFNHEISLTFTDMLGTLKDVTLDQAAVNVGVDHTETGVTCKGALTNTIQIYDARGGVLKPGDWFKLDDGTNTYEFICIEIGYNTLTGYTVVVSPDQTLPGTLLPYDFTYKIPYVLNGYIPLIDVVRLCLKSTFLTDLRLNSFISIYPVGAPNESLLEDTYVDALTFFDGNNWQDCYTILENIMSRFNASLFQADGKWMIVRWDEMYRYTNTAGATMQGFDYDTDFVFQGNITSVRNFEFMTGSDMESGVMKSIERPFQYVKETFNYVQPEDLPCNSNIQKLGNLLNQYTVGTNIIKEYEIVDWYNFVSSPYPTRYIRITIDNDSTSSTYLQEIERIIVIFGATFSAPRSVKSCDIPISVSDSIEYSFSFKTGISQPGAVTTVFAVSITDGTSTYYLKNDGSWAGSIGFSYQVLSGDNTNQWHTVSINSKGAPISGILNVYLAEATPNGTSPSTDETHYKDITLKINYFIDGSGKVIGHTHNSLQSIKVKNNLDETIYFDNTVSSSIKGTLFLESYTGVLRDRTLQWTYPSSSFSPSLGINTTTEALFTRYKPRAKYEGNLLYVKTGNGPYKFINPLAVFKWNKAPNLFRFVPGKMAIDYKNSSIEFTLYELLDNETGFDSNIILEYVTWAQSRVYEFNYLYENK